MEEVYFSLGSNLGDRRKNLETALEKMEERFGRAYEKCSSIIETESWGFEGNDFLNCAVKFRVELSPAETLGVCKQIEREMGRSDAPEYDAEGRRVYHNRTIDIDILLFGSVQIDTEELTIPHPRMQEREFVMKPLKEII